MSDAKIKSSKFDLGNFRLSQEKMVATSDTVYQKYGYRTETARQYTEERIEWILQYGDPISKRNLSQHYFYTNGIYQQIILYYQTLLRYSWMLLPKVAQSKSMTNGTLQKKYFDALEFVEKINIPRLCLQFSLDILRDGGYYGLIIAEDKTTLTILDLPFNYCRTRYKDFAGNDIIEFNLFYFHSIYDEKERETTLAIYPQYIQEQYALLENGTLADPWIKISSDSGICFPSFGNQPLFLSIIPSIYNFEDYTGLEKERDADEIKKLIIQKIPYNTSTGEFLFEPEEAEEIHKGTVGMMKNNKNFSVLTTYAEVEVVGSEAVNENVSKNNLEKILAGVYERAGVSSNLFATDGNLSLGHSINKDIALMMEFATKYAHFFTTMVNRHFSTTDISFQFTILPISYDNQSEYLDQTMKLLPNGYSLLLPWIAMGFTQGSLTSLKDLENEILKLQEKLIPPMNSNTADTTGGTEGGRPGLDPDKKNPRTLANEQSKEGGS